jgi:hypothetical protein
VRAVLGMRGSADEMLPVVSPTRFALGRKAWWRKVCGGHWELRGGDGAGPALWVRSYVCYAEHNPATEGPAPAVLACEWHGNVTAGPRFDPGGGAGR